MIQISPLQGSETQRIAYSQRTPEYYLNRLNPEVLNSLDAFQLDDIRRILDEAIPKPSPKLVDLRFTVDLLLAKYYIVLMLGKERRRRPRQRQLSSRVTRLGNIIAAVILLLGLNLLISAGVFLTAYLIKSAVGINLFPEHLADMLQKI